MSNLKSLDPQTEARVMRETGLAYEPWLHGLEVQLREERARIIYLPRVTTRRLALCEKYIFLRDQVQRIRSLMLRFVVSYTD